jgi:hypothetical protein
MSGAPILFGKAESVLLKRTRRGVGLLVFTPESSRTETF